GWALKVLLLRFGGSTAFQAARPLFIGLIFGEALAAATWLVINFLLATSAHTYFPVHVLPAYRAVLALQHLAALRCVARRQDWCHPPTMGDCGKRYRSLQLMPRSRHLLGTLYGMGE